LLYFSLKYIFYISCLEQLDLCVRSHVSLSRHHVSNGRVNNERLFTCAGQYSIPAPKGGRHAHNIILREDQKEYKDAVQRQQRFERALEKGLDIFSPEYMTQGSPFGVAGPHERAQACACFARRWLGVRSSLAAFAHRLGLGSVIRTK
jgi:hypothetical protein